MFQSLRKRWSNDNGPQRGGDNGDRRQFRPRSIESRPRMRGASGIGYEVTETGRKQRAYGFMLGLTASADRHLTRIGLGRLREMCRMHDRQSSLLSGILDRAIDNIFGANFDFVPCTGDEELNKKVKEYIHRRMQKQLCDASGVRNFAGMAKTALRAIWTDGDNLLVKRENGSILAFEADQIMTPSNRQNGPRIVMGIELNDLNGPVAYHVKQRLTSSDYGGVQNTEETKRVTARNAIMPAYRKRFNQTRGVPFLAVVMQQYNRTENYIDYETLAAEGNAMLGYKVKKGPTENPLPGLEDNEDTGSTFDKVQKMEPFMVFELEPEEDIDMIGSQRPGSQFEPYIITCCRIIGVGVGMPLELVMLDFSKTNYSSARASLGEARRSFRNWQTFAGDDICRPWYDWQISRAIANGELPAKPEIYKMRCQWPAWEYIDPYKAEKANELAIQATSKSISECIRERGQEPDEVFTEIAEDRKKLAKLGIPLNIYQPKGAGNALP